VRFDTGFYAGVTTRPLYSFHNPSRANNPGLATLFVAILTVCKIGK
jgi:hypothetical protein